MHTFKTKPEAFICFVCKTSFTKYSSLNVHKRVHAGIKQFKYNVCDKSFTKKGNLTSHLLVKNGKKDF